MTPLEELKQELKTELADYTTVKGWSKAKHHIRIQELKKEIRRLERLGKTTAYVSVV